MRADLCPRSFEAEAMRDGRLGDAERASFERHTRTCPACAREVQALDALGRALRESTHEQADDLRVRRERTRLLAAFDHELLVPERHSGPRGRLVWPLAAAVLVAALAVFWRARPARPVATPASRAVVRADDSTAWSQRWDGDLEDVVLERGALWIHVDHGPGHRRLTVILPDGELEDTGTTFTIAAANGHTTRVAVEEGSVVLRLRGEPPVSIGSGETWSPSTPALSPCATPAPSAEPPSSASPLPPPMLSGPAPRASGPLPVALPTDASSDFRSAMSALDRGDDPEAAAGFAAFLTKHPRDPRAEDAAYLRVIALERCGDRDATKAAALDYLSRYPTGFRRAEVENLSGPH
jgi:FecR protein